MFINNLIQVQAAKIARMMWSGAPDWRERKDQFCRDENSVEGILEGVAQCCVTAFIIVMKYVEHDKVYGYRPKDVTGEELFGPGVLVLLIISAVGSLLSGIIGIYYFLLEGPLKFKLGEGVGNKILLVTVIIFGMLSRFGSLSTIFIFSTALKLEGFWLALLSYTAIGLGIQGVSILLSLIPLMSFGPRRFLRLVFCYPHILVIPLFTPFTYGLVCAAGCVCHCCCCCGCSEPRLALSRTNSLANHIVTLLLMIPPIIFFNLIDEWSLIAAQLCIGVLGLVTAPLLLFQPGRIAELGVLSPDRVKDRLLARVEVEGDLQSEDLTDGSNTQVKHRAGKSCLGGASFLLGPIRLEASHQPV
jgi:hypothetical protein